MTHAFTPAPRRPDGAQAVPDLPRETMDDLLRAADAVACAHPGAGASCRGDARCQRAGTVTVMVHDDAALMCGLHAMAAVFATPGLVALVKSDAV